MCVCVCVCVEEGEDGLYPSSTSGPLLVAVICVAVSRPRVIGLGYSMTDCTAGHHRRGRIRLPYTTLLSSESGAAWALAALRLLHMFVTVTWTPLAGSLLC